MRLKTFNYLGGAALCVMFLVCNARDCASARRETVRKVGNDNNFSAMSADEHAAAALREVDADQPAEALRHAAAVADTAPQKQELTRVMDEALVEKVKKMLPLQGHAVMAAEHLAALSDTHPQRKVLEAMVKKALDADAAEGRRRFAKTLERQLLDQRMDTTITASSKDATTLTIRYVLAGRVMAHELAKDTDILKTARGLGFSKVVLTDGYSSSWSWDLTK